MRPGEAEEATEHRSGAEGRREQPSRCSASEAECGDEWLQGEEREEQTESTLAKEDGVRHVLAVPEQLWVLDTDEPERGKCERQRDEDLRTRRP